MTHVYLNANVIKDALKAREITEREAKEMTSRLKGCEVKRSREGRRRERKVIS
ncbi:hypothetical protein WCX49_13145 [Sulfurimonas sp. HSL-1656]|uniref:hypothetical protein n=1 Tax=Thiomicrolovo subterrani TaxID=3131934 RepID=UPI0031F96291